MRMIQLNREKVFMNVRNAAMAGVLLAAIAACSNDNGTQPAGGNTYLRFVNSTYQQGADVATSVSAGGTTYDSTITTFTAIPIDILIDSSSSAPSTIGLAPNTVDVGTTGPAPLASANARYRPASVGVHSFVARVSGLTPAGPTFFTTPSPTQYLPRQFLTNTTYYTFAIAGINPVQPTSGGPALAASDAFGSQFPLFVDDPFTPPSVTPTSGPKYLEARFRVHNFAPFANTSGGNDALSVYLTDTDAAPSDVSGLVALGTAYYRGQTGYINVKAGDYWLTIVGGGGLVVYSGSIHFDEGDVRSLVVQNAMTTHRHIVAVATPTVGAAVTTDVWDTPTFKLTDIKDNQYTL